MTDMNNIQEQEFTTLPLIGDDAPKFTARTTKGVVNFPEDYAGKWVILFSHPSDFTPVCTTEFMTFGTMQEDFRNLNTELIGLSVDSLFSHIAWARNIEEKIEYKGMKNVKIDFPIIEDLEMTVAKKYGMIQPKTSNTEAVRAVFIIDPEGKIRTILYYPQSTGRNFDEIKRIILALQKSEKDGVATPADWRPGDDVIVPPAQTVEEADKRMNDDSDTHYAFDWYMQFKKDQ